MYLERLLQINIATMAALGTLLLGMGQQNAALPLAMFVAVIASFWLTDVTGWLRLSRNVTNVAATAAFFLFLWQVLLLPGWLDRILGIGKFLVYLQIILLFQKKDARTYGSLALLSLVQVVVAAAFYQNVLFGLLLVAYLFVGLSALVLLFLHRERGRHRAARSLAPAPVAGGRRWPLAGQEAVFTLPAGGAGGQAGIGRELWSRVVRMGFGTLVLTLAVFFILPRWGHHPWRGVLGSRRLTVGFSDKVALGDLGRIIDDPTEVLRIQFFDHETDEPYRVLGEVYLRGAVLTHYHRGEWEYRGVVSPGVVQPLGMTPVVTTADLVRQKITIEPMDREELFCVWPFANPDEEQDLLIDQRRQVLLRPQDQMARRFVYQLITIAFRKNSQVSLVPTPSRETAQIRFLCDPPPTEGDGAVPGLVALADAWLSRSGLDPEDQFARARFLERQLRDSGRFQYSLEGQPRDLMIDPVEDFVTNNPRGHCEYFATALVLMLRSQGIPARMVVGYRTDEWNNLGYFFQVRQLHAHTWVEAYLEPGQLQGRPDPAGVLVEAPHGAWLRLDPSPVGSVTRVNSLLDLVGESFDWLNFLWANYVIEMDQPRQRRAIYDPLADAIKEAARRATDPAWWRGNLANLKNAVGTGLRNLILGLAIAVVAIALVALCQLFRIAWRRRRSRLAGRLAPGARSGRAGVEFYRRLEAVLARFGLTRPNGKTQREFAREAGLRIAASTGQHHLAELPGQVVEAFYRVRFGGIALDSPRAEAVEQALSQLRLAVSSRR